MLSRRESRILPYTAEHLYAVTADVERYPDFLPWCRALRVLAREPAGETEILTAEMTVGFGAIVGAYVSRVTLSPTARTIVVTQARGPFRRLDSRWAFTPVAAGTRVDFSIALEMRNPFFQGALATAFETVLRQQAAAFAKRAEALQNANRAYPSGRR